MSDEMHYIEALQHQHQPPPPPPQPLQPPPLAQPSQPQPQVLQPWPAAAQAAPAFVHEGKPMDIVLKMRLWDLLSSNMIVLGEVSVPSFDEAVAARVRGQPSRRGQGARPHRGREHRRDSWARGNMNGAKRRGQHRLHRGSPMLQTTRPSAGQM